VIRAVNPDHRTTALLVHARWAAAVCTLQMFSFALSDSQRPLQRLATTTDAQPSHGGTELSCPGCTDDYLSDPSRTFTPYVKAYCYKRVRMLPSN